MSAKTLSPVILSEAPLLSSEALSLVTEALSASSKLEKIEQAEVEQAEVRSRLKGAARIFALGAARSLKVPTRLPDAVGDA